MKVAIRVTTLVSLLVGVAGAVQAVPLSIDSTSDSASQRFLFHNETISPLRVGLGPGPGAMFSMTIDRFSKASVIAQCMADAARTPPPLTVDMGGEPRVHPTKTIDLSSGAPAIWLSRARSGRARLEGLIRQVDPDVRLRHQAIEEAPRYFSAIRFSPMILASLETMLRLDEAQQSALLTAVAGGSVLVLASGESTRRWPALKALVDVEVGTAMSVGPELRAMLPSIVARRQLTLGTRARPSVTLDGQTLVSETRYGLGAIRVVGLGFGDLAGRNLSKALFTRVPDSLGSVFSWLSSRSSLSTAQKNPIALHLVGTLFLLPLGLWLTRRRPKAILAYCGIWTVTAAFIPAHLSAHRIGDARAVVVPAGDHSLALGLLELSVNGGGRHLLTLGEQDFSLDDVRGGSTCLLDTPEGAFLSLEAAPGQTYRLLFMFRTPGISRGEEQVEQMRGTRGSAVRGTVLRRRSEPVRLTVAGRELPLDSYHLDLAHIAR